jgi:hypothetical protein
MQADLRQELHPHRRPLVEAALEEASGALVEAGQASTVAPLVRLAENPG